MQVHKSDKCEAGWEIKSKNIGSGTYGKTYQSCCTGSGRCDYIAKIQKITKRNTAANISNEIAIQTRAADLNVSIPIFDSWVEDGDYVIIMPRLKQTFAAVLANAVKQCKQDSVPCNQAIEQIVKYIEEVYRYLKILAKNGINHNDAFMNNIMFDDRGKMYLIDFGVATIGDTGYTPDKDISLLLENIFSTIKNDNFITSLYQALPANLKKIARLYLK
ncbi:MAG: protein kinase domain-containing protein [Sulfobacillus sp.]